MKIIRFAELIQNIWWFLSKWVGTRSSSAPNSAQTTDFQLSHILIIKPDVQYGDVHSVWTEWWTSDLLMMRIWLCRLAELLIAKIILLIILKWLFMMLGQNLMLRQTDSKEEALKILSIIGTVRYFFVILIIFMKSQKFFRSCRIYQIQRISLLHLFFLKILNRRATFSS